jgi:polysaccharide biosynthesis/export protein
MTHSLRYLKLAAALIVFVMLGSCRTSQKISYFQDLDAERIAVLTDSLSTNMHVRIKPSDVLAITVSALDETAVAPFNMPAVSYMHPGQTELGSTAGNLVTYTVDSQGDINFPVIGKVHLEGLTREQSIELLQNRISQYVKDPIVNVSFTNFYVSVLGEVNGAGTVWATGDRLSILDAISRSGDLSIYGRRDNVLLIREVEGHREFHRLDLTRSDIFASPYYYLQQGDVIYVEPNEKKQKNANYSQQDSYNMSLYSAFISTASVIVSLVIALLVK